MRLAILCSGQAGQHRSMLDGLLDAPECKSVWQAASAVLGQDIAQWWRALDEREIFLNANAQFAIACYQLATWKRIAHLMPQVSLVAGYSLGELIAYHIAGALDVAETLRLVRTRARLMDAAMPGSKGGCMALWRGRVSPATMAKREQLIGKCDLSVAIKRRHGEEVLAGTADAIERFIAELQPLNPSLMRLPVTIPSHSHHLAAAAAAFREVLNASALAAPQTPVLAGVDAAPVRTREQAIVALSLQMANTISWDGCMETLAESGIDRAIELGPGNDLARLLEAEHENIAARAVSDFRDYRALSDWLN
jgi:[acyl-carrier-protein] S-malonyltransferase